MHMQSRKIEHKVLLRSKHHCNSYYEFLRNYNEEDHSASQVVWQWAEMSRIPLQVLARGRIGLHAFLA